MVSGHELDVNSILAQYPFDRGGKSLALPILLSTLIPRSTQIAFEARALKQYTHAVIPRKYANTI